ncbi:amino acid ABC transporter permease [Nonomuraea rhizosphaerae]|uniref:amino acid ABC transporter permease n=1 Tax=Nonomuraea rhizosphaerae TaxID=2665663 RepID=UPI001C600946|nr:amino acid ABC transporter permease [Nonomuraea rhizosphaerae]
MNEIIPYLPKIFEGYATTARIAVLSILLAAVVAGVLGTLRVGRSRAVRVSTATGLELLRGTSVLVQLFWVYYALPLLPGGVMVDPAFAAVFVLGLNGGAYGAETVRAGLRSIPHAQGDACHALGLSRAVTLFKVRLPQAWSQIVPAFGSIAVDMVKWTSIVSFVTVQDVLYWGNTARAHTNETIPVYLLIGALYLLLCLAVAGIFRTAEYFLPLTRSVRAVRRAATAGALGGAR